MDIFIWVSIIAYTKLPLISDPAGVSNRAQCVIIGLRLYLHPYFVYASRERFCESVLVLADEKRTKLLCNDPILFIDGQII